MSLRFEVVKYAKKISEEGLTKGTWGNISVRDERYIYITPSGYPYDKLTSDDIVIVDYDGKIVEGQHKPSSELPLHIEIYKARKDVFAIIHTHPVYSTVVSVSCDQLPPIVEDAVMILGERILVSQYAFPGTEELAKNAVASLGNNHAVFLKNHGLVTVGENLQEAFIASLIAEKTAQVYVEAMKIGRVSTLKEEDASKLRQKYLKAYKQTY